MKKNSTWKLVMLTLALTVSIAACKKKDNPQPAPPVEVKNITITDLRALSTGASVKVPDGRKVKGIVISDASAKNIDAKTVVLQEATDKPGMIVTFDAAQTFALGDEIEVTISNQTLAQANGEVVLQNIPAANAKKTGTGAITPRSATIAEITTNKATWDGTLVSIADGLFSGSGKYTGTLSYASGNASIKTLITTGATFENTDYPALVTGLTGIIRISGNDVFINVRNPSDVKTSSGSFVMVEDFSGTTPKIYSQFRAIANNQQMYGYPLVTSLTAKYPDYWGGTGSSNGWGINKILGVNAISVIKNLTVGSGDPDAGFLSTNRNYYVTMPAALERLFSQLGDPTNTARYGSDWQNFASSFPIGRGQSSVEDYLKTLKSITIVFAGSKMKVADFDPTSTVTSDVKSNAFDSTKDGFYATLYTQNSQKIDASEIYTDQNVWHTVKFNDVNSKLLAADQAGNFNSTIFLTFVSKLNASSSFNGGSNSALSFKGGTSIVIDKIILEFSEKPTWAN